MRRTPLLRAAAAVTLLALTGCGSKTAGPGGTGAQPRCPSATGTPQPLPAATLTRDGVTITGVSGGGHGCRSGRFFADFTVTNPERTAMTYTVTFRFRPAPGDGTGIARQTVPAVGPGRTARGSVVLGELPADASAVTGVSVEQVRSVPTAEAPSQGGPCPASGTRLYPDQGDAAMGLRVVGLHLENCGTRPYALDGRPALRVLGADHAPVTGVRVVPGESVATSTGADGTPRPLTLAPGERAYAVLVWRNTTEAGDPVNAPYVRVWARPGAAPVTVTPELDLGTTGRLGIGPWKKEDAG
ncbi:DUF4232 domain-containing protein [Streptomyces sp. NPDC001606]